MEFLYEKVAYLNGLIDGMELDESTKEGKALIVIAEILEDLVEELEELTESQTEMEEFVDLMDEDLSNVEEELFGEFDIDELDEDVEEVTFDEE
ncbi:MAG: hypothetical protein JXQ26_02800 [Tissierellales bacterium]|jgi:DNA-directed RNA polymerase subunit delta|nr:hypothetical protein [Tissierellales bacterium]MBN2826887.1 hypothetical protein [Tissierellales bacterium]